MTNQPDFLIIGAMKAGTTSLHDYLGEHPDIHVTTPKELHFFHQEEDVVENGMNAYLEHFKSSKKIAGTSPQNYTKRHNKYYQDIPRKLHQYFPNVKLIYVLRDPIARYKSHLLENYYGEPKHDVEYNLKSHHYLKTGLYYYQLQAYLKYFELSQIHILTLEDLISNKLETLNKLFSFLQVEEVKDEALFDYVSNKKEDKQLPRQIKYSFPYRALKKMAPQLANAFAHSTSVRKFYLEKGKIKLLSSIDENMLQEKYLEDVEKLRQLTGLSFEKWSV